MPGGHPACSDERELPTQAGADRSRTPRIRVAELDRDSRRDQVSVRAMHQRMAQAERAERVDRDVEAIARALALDALAGPRLRKELGARGRHARRTRALSCQRKQHVAEHPTPCEVDPPISQEPKPRAVPGALEPDPLDGARDLPRRAPRHPPRSASERPLTRRQARIGKRRIAVMRARSALDREKPNPEVPAKRLTLGIHFPSAEDRT